jgi:hypothetical protein
MIIPVDHRPEGLRHLPLESDDPARVIAARYSIPLRTLARHREQCQIHCTLGSDFHPRCPDQQHLSPLHSGQIFSVICAVPSPAAERSADRARLRALDIRDHALDGRLFVRRIVTMSTSFAAFHRERADAWPEITPAQDPRRAEAVRRRHVQTQIAASLGVSRTAA